MSERPGFDFKGRSIKEGRTMDDNERAWRRAIADQVRANCTPSAEAYEAGGDRLIEAVADWIEHPPEWSAFTSPQATR